MSFFENRADRRRKKKLEISHYATTEEDSMLVSIANIHQYFDCVIFFFSQISCEKTNKLNWSMHNCFNYNLRLLVINVCFICK